MTEPGQTDNSRPAAEIPGVAMLTTLGLIAAISGLLVVMSFKITEPMIEKNKREAIEKALYRVLPGATTRRDFLARDGQLFPAGQATDGIPVYAAYNDAGKLVGVGLEAAAFGYQDVIRMLFGYDPYCQCIRGINVLKLAETPGIGDKITSDQDFLQNFDALDTRLNVDGSALAHDIIAVKHGSKNEPWQIDAISGATISSTAVARMLNDSSQQVMPVIQQNLAVLENAL